MDFSVPNVKEIIMSENKKVTRRKFLEDSSKKALVGSAAAFLGLGMKPKPAQAGDNCLWYCYGGCGGTCSGNCDGCTGGCSGECTNGCSHDCMGECNSIGFSCTPAECGTPVSEREGLTQHVTV